MSKEKAYLHQGHRKRMYERFELGGSNFSNFRPHEILEVLLFICIKRKNTNCLAHDILDEFGTLYNVIHAPKKELIKINGVGEKTADFLIHLGELYDNDYTEDGDPKHD